MIPHTFPGQIDILDRFMWRNSVGLGRLDNGRLTAVRFYPGSGTASDTDVTWTCPAGFAFADVICIGGGGGGGGAGAAIGPNCAIGSGGGAGGVVIQRVQINNILPGETATVRSGHGGAGGANTGANGADGTASSFGIGSDTHGVILSGPGGIKGIGMASAATVVTNAGGDGGISNLGPGAGGNGAWSVRLDGVTGYGGEGGDVTPFGGGGLSVPPVGLAGNPGRQWGGGGSGGGSTGNTGKTGGGGAPGMVKVYEYSQ